MHYIFKTSGRKKHKKLKDLNVHPHILRCTKPLYISIYNSSSDILPVYSGLLQGSVLEPELFIVYVKPSL